MFFSVTNDKLRHMNSYFKGNGVDNKNTFELIKLVVVFKSITAHDIKSFPCSCSYCVL